MNEEGFRKILRDAGAHEPLNVSRAAHGLETRVVARIRQDSESSPFILESALRLIWRSALGLLVVVGIFTMGTWFSGALDPGEDLLLELWSGALSMELHAGLE